MRSFRVWQGHPYPPGAARDGEGMNFPLFSEGAEKVEPCLFDPCDPLRGFPESAAGEKHALAGRR